MQLPPPLVLAPPWRFSCPFPFPFPCSFSPLDLPLCRSSYYRSQLLSVLLRSSTVRRVWFNINSWCYRGFSVQNLTGLFPYRLCLSLILLYLDIMLQQAWQWFKLVQKHYLEITVEAHSWGDQLGNSKKVVATRAGRLRELLTLKLSISVSGQHTLSGS